MKNIRHSLERDRAWARYYAKHGVTGIATRSTRVPTPCERYVAWIARRPDIAFVNNFPWKWRAAHGHVASTT